MVVGGLRMENNLVITTSEELCEGCNKCINVCPIPDANIAYSLNGKNKVKVDPNKCIHCGHCIKACDHGAREYNDDVERFFKDLKCGKNISILIAPSFRINFKEYKRILGFLKAVGVNLIYDVSLGAEISTWACMKSIKERSLSSIIGQSCPVIVNYIQKYQPELIEFLAPAHSPMMCSAIYLKKYYGCSDQLAFLSPCIAKKDEINDINTASMVKYNVTYSKFMDYVIKNHINLNEYEEADYDITGFNLGLIFSKPGGFKENIEMYMEDIWIDEVSGQNNVYKYLKKYKERLMNKQPKPNILDILNCSMGCNSGTAVAEELSIFDIGYVCNKLKEEKIREGIKDINEVFDGKLDVKDFIRGYQDLSKEITSWKEPSEIEYENIFTRLHKYISEDKNLNCRDCGYNGCKDMAKAIYNNVNYEGNCIYYNKHELQIEIHEKKRILKELEYIAFNDPLTDVYNRRGIKARLEAAIDDAELKNGKLGILFIDVDRFKMINDVFGHDEGDYVLKEIINRLNKVIGKFGVIGRLGGDEFLAIIDDFYDEGEIYNIGKNIIEIFQESIQLRHRKIKVTCSLGICIFPDHGEDAETLLKNADISMYRAKKNHGNGLEIYDKELTNNLHRQFKLLDGMERGIGKKEFIIYYQPKVEVRTGEIVGLEALVRWNHPDMGIIPPNEFITVAEELGLIEKLDQYVLKTACNQIKEWTDREIKPKNISVNISGRIFNDVKFLDKVDSIISEMNVNTSLISIEITETVAINNIHHTNAILKKLREKGIKILLDDFGKGYSSLNYLKEFPIDVLKIDKSFIDEICTSNINKAIMQAVINMAKMLGIEVVAEGVEENNQLEVLKELGCDYFQGYLFSKPIPVEEVEKLLLK